MQEGKEFQDHLLMLIYLCTTVETTMQHIRITSSVSMFTITFVYNYVRMYVNK